MWILCYFLLISAPFLFIWFNFLLILSLICRKRRKKQHNLYLNQFVLCRIFTIRNCHFAWLKGFRNWLFLYIFFRFVYYCCYFIVLFCFVVVNRFRSFLDRNRLRSVVLFVWHKFHFFFFIIGYCWSYSSDFSFVLSIFSVLRYALCGTEKKIESKVS